ncbi:MAG: seg [Candidatus Kaiserbacteria bacterium]|nr:seg [Candidatus Kaiserbacteria bacterium]
MKIYSSFRAALEKLFPTFASAFSGTRTKGFTLLLAALVASIVLSLGTSVYTIAVKQVQLSSLGRDSQFAFYTADTGAECALYWDVRFDAFATSSVAAPTCDGQAVTITAVGSDYPYTREFEVNLFSDQSTGYCADVLITKNSTNPHTVIHADGYSVTCAERDASTRALQRSVELQY